ncbi:MAG: RNA polymerase sigma factor [Acidimicrobiia bacterium]|nr:RNA polymerase sigma factor [Acidimicrobiia bacterium]
MNDFQERLDQARAGDERGWQALFRLVSGRVVGFLVARGAPDPEAVAGDVFLDVVRSIRRFDGDERGFIAWVMTITRRRLVDARRASGRRAEDPTDPSDIESHDSADVEGEALGLASAAEARVLLDHLTPDQADVITLRVYGELTMPEVARELDKPLTAVTSLQKRALDRLRRLLDEPA